MRDKLHPVPHPLQFPEVEHPVLQWIKSPVSGHASALVFAGIRQLVVQIGASEKDDLLPLSHTPSTFSKLNTQS